MSRTQGPSDRPSVTDRLFALPQYALPHHLLSSAMERLARSRARWFKDPLIRWFCRHYGIDLGEAWFRSPGAYPDFNSFFTRALRPGARPVAPEAEAVASPVDGVVSQAGGIDGEALVQAKGRTFDLTRLLGGDPAVAAPFRGGAFATVYLSPRDYHRIHAPVACVLRGMVHVPGRLFSVNPATTRVVPNLFARNERVVALFDAASGPMALVMVGAVFVGSVETAWHGVVTPPRSGAVRRWDYPEGSIRLRKGEELGRFNLGSTVVLVFGRGAVRWDGHLCPGRTLRMGERIGTWAPP